MNAEYDGIILGTGHNALVLHAYLARCGLRVLSLDRAPWPEEGWRRWRTRAFPASGTISIRSSTGPSR